MGAFAVLELFIRQGKAAKSVELTATDRGTTVLIVAAYVLAVVASTSRILPVIAMPLTVAWASVVVGVFGFGFRVWSMRVLGRFYTRTLVTTAEQHVVRRGPYRFVRHPGYLGSMLVWVGAAASSANLLSVALVVVLLVVAYSYRIRVEERMLVDSLGEAYVEYCRHSWRLVPFVF